MSGPTPGESTDSGRVAAMLGEHLRREFWNPDNGGNWERIAGALVEAGVGFVAQERQLRREFYEAGREDGRNERADVVAQAKAEALREAAAAVGVVRRTGLPEGMISHPTAEHFEDWLRVRADREATS